LATIDGSENLLNKTLTAPMISTISNSGTITLPTGTRTLATLDGAETLSNKTLSGPVISTISNGAGTLTLPSSNDTLVGRATTDTLSNKTLTMPTISSISNSGTITLPTGNRTLATLDGTETLTNKTISTSGLLTAGAGFSVTGGDASMNTRLFVSGDASMGGNMTVFGNLYAVTQPNTDNSTKVATTAYVKSLTTSASFNGTTIFNGDVSLNGRLFVSSDVSINGNVSVVTQAVGDNSAKVATTAFVKSQEYATVATPTFTGKVTSMGDMSLNTNLSIGGDIAVNGKITANTMVFGLTKYYNWSGSPSASTINSPRVTLTFGNNSFYAKIHCFVTEGASANNMSSQVIEVQGGHRTGGSPGTILVVSRITAGSSFSWNYPTVDANTVNLTTSAMLSNAAYYSIRVELIQGNTTNPPTLNSVTMVNDNLGGTAVTNFGY